MGFYDRDYYRAQPARGGFGHFVAWSVTTWLIVINVVVFFADAAIERAQRQQEISADEDGSGMYVPPVSQEPSTLTRWGAFSTRAAISNGQVWRFLTFQFLHAYPWHIIVNMLGLFFFGPIVEGHFGARRYLAFYLLCGFAGALCFTLLAYTGFLHVHPTTPLVGASAGIFGLLMACAVIAPDVQLFYYIMPVTIRMAAIFAMLLAAYTVLNTGYNAGGEAAHLGGGVLGFLLIKNQHWLNPFAPSRRIAAVRRRPMKKDWSKDFDR